MVDTQRLRRELMQSLQELFEIASEWAGKGDAKAARLAGYIAQVMNSLASSYEATKFQEDLRLLDQLIEEAKARREKP
ncbi:MAG: hypothetical protein ACP5JW_07340 [Candidatus Bathyarchaeia archaeon]